MRFDDNHLTDAGESLVAGVLAGQTITFTRAVLGDGDMPEGASPADMTSVSSPRAEASITMATRTEDGRAVIGVRYSNEDQDADFEWSELGLYAKGPDGTEVLYAYGHDDAPELMPKGGETLVEKLLYVVTYVGEDAEVTATFDPDFVVSIYEITEDDIDAVFPHEHKVYDESIACGAETASEVFPDLSGGPAGQEV